MTGKAKDLDQTIKSEEEQIWIYTDRKICCKGKIMKTELMVKSKPDQ